MLRFRKLEKAVNVDRPIPPYFDGCKLCSAQTIIIPPHHAYTLDDLQRAGVRIAPVDTTLFHDDSALSDLINNSDDSAQSDINNNSDESSKND